MMSWDFSVNLVATRKPGVVQHSLSWMPSRLGRETPKVWRQKVGKRVSCWGIARGSREVRSSSMQGLGRSRPCSSIQWSRGRSSLKVRMLSSTIQGLG